MEETNNNEKIEFYCLGSGSTGNCYAFRKHKEVVIVEAGIEYQNICKKLIEYGILPSEIKAVICTHAHKDHTLGVADLFRHGAKPYLDENLANNPEVKDKAKLKMTNWLTAYCFKVNHDIDAYGFAFLDTENKESYLFINDTAEFDFPLKSIAFDGIFIECNYIQTQLDAIRRQAKQKFKYDRQEKTHLSLLGTKNMLSQMNLSKTKLIVLMHLSMDCANETAMKTEIESVFKIRTLVAKRQGGMN